jgi:hypothetical protein
MTQETWRFMAGVVAFASALFVFSALLTGCTAQKAVFDCVTHPKDCN